MVVSKLLPIPAQEIFVRVPTWNDHLDFFVARQKRDGIIFTSQTLVVLMNNRGLFFCDISGWGFYRPSSRRCFAVVGKGWIDTPLLVVFYFVFSSLYGEFFCFSCDSVRLNTRSLSSSASDASWAAHFLVYALCRAFQERWLGSFLWLGARFGIVSTVLGLYDVLWLFDSVAAVDG